MSDHEACLVKVKNNVQFFESVIAASMSNENNVEAKELYASNLKRNIEKLKLMKFQFDNNSNDVCANKNSKNNCNNNGFTERKITCGNVRALNESPSKSSDNKINFPNFSSYSTKNSTLVPPTTASANDDNPNIETVSSPSVAVLKAKLESHQSFQDSLLYSSLTVPRKRLDRNANNNNNGGSNLVLRESSMYNSSAGIVRKGHFIKEISEDDININNVNDINNSNDVSTTTSTTTTSANSDQMKINKMDKKAAKLDKVQQEFVHTETRYVKRLAALCENFQKQVIAYNMTALPYQYAPLDKLFPDITKIYKFHVNKLLPGLKECLEYSRNKSLPKKLLGQLFVDLEFDFQVYEHYPAAYKECLSVLEKCVTNYQGFAPVVFDFEERLEISEGLKLKYFFIEPIQRLPRYELLLKEYCSCLGDDAEDLPNAEIALNLIKQLNLLWNANIKKQENYFKMKEIEDKIVDSIDLISSPREIVKEGVVDLIQPTGVQEKYFFLFTDMLLICQYVPHPFRPPYYINTKLDVSQLQYKTNHGKIYLFSPQAVIQFQPRSQEDVTSWLKAFEETLKGRLGSNSSSTSSSLTSLTPFNHSISFRDSLSTPTSAFSSSTSPLSFYNNHNSTDNNNFGTSIGAGGNKKNSTIKNLGTVAPVMIKEQDVQFCMQCGEEFSLIFNKKQSCYCCGKVVCKTCSLHKEALPYDGLKIKRVCNVCYEVLQENLTLVQKMFG